MLTHKAMVLFMCSLQATLSGPEGLRTCFPTVPSNSECAETAEIRQTVHTQVSLQSQPSHNLPGCPWRSGWSFWNSSFFLSNSCWKCSNSSWYFSFSFSEMSFSSVGFFREEEVTGRELVRHLACVLLELTTLPLA